MFVVTRAHETFYEEELSDVDASRIVTQPANRGTGVAVIVALLRVLQHDANPVVAFFPSDHYFADQTAFAEAVRSAIDAARTHRESLILLGAAPREPEVDYGWIEPGAALAGGGRTPLLRVSRFWEKPSLATARALMRRGGLWNTFVTVGRAGSFLRLLGSTVPATVSALRAAVARDDMDAVYGDVGSVDFSRDVLSREPRRLLVIPHPSGWADLGNPDRVRATLARHHVGPEASWSFSPSASQQNAASPGKFQTDPHDRRLL